MPAVPSPAVATSSRYRLRLRQSISHRTTVLSAVDVGSAEVLPPIPDYVHDPAHQAAVLKDLKKRHADLIARDAPDLSPAPVSHAALAGMRSAIYLIEAIDLTGLEPDAREPFFDLCDQAAELINEKRGALQ